VRTWAPRGQAPVLRETFNWDKLSVIAGLTLWNCYFRLYEGSINGERAAEFLRALRRHLPGKLLVTWDGAAIHRSQPVKAVLTESGGRLWLEKLPAYAPELNPVEYLWAHLKRHQIANLLVTQGWELSLHATAALRRMRRRPRIIRACWHQAELGL
jgi:transposase